ncbi:dCTP deaminase [Candidatus Woesearchaeota archaeon]|nr:dCTP deaminase [Candidatus Woesearchaeota archaeon]
MLSNLDILEAIKNKDLIIDPFDETNIRPAGLTFHLGDTLFRPKANGRVVDTSKNELPDYEEIKIKDSESYLLKSGEFIIGQIYEKIGISNKLSMMLEGRSTLARLGISVVQSAMILDTGQEPKICALEIKNNGPNDVKIYHKMRVARAVVFELKTPASFDYISWKRYDKNDNGKPIVSNWEIKK